MQRTLRGLVSIRDAYAYESIGLLGQRVQAIQLACYPPASVIALPAERRMPSPTLGGSGLQCSHAADSANPRCWVAAFRGAGSELGELSEGPRGKSLTRVLFAAR